MLRVTHIGQKNMGSVLIFRYEPETIATALRYKTRNNKLVPYWQNIYHLL